MQIRDLELVTEGKEEFWRARVVINGESVPVDRRYGSWRIPGPHGSERDVLPDVAEVLQDRARKAERRMGREVRERRSMAA